MKFEPKAPAIIQKFLDGDMDAGGTIRALELYIQELEERLNQLQPTSPFSSDICICPCDSISYICPIHGRKGTPR